MLEVDCNEGAVLVVGGGIAGMHASLILAEAGVRVFLVDSAPTCGGIFSLLDRTFPNASCGVCQMAVSSQAYCPMLEVERHPMITLMTNSRVRDVQGQVGDFTVTVEQKGEYILKALCDSCGKCEAVCPIEVDVRPIQGFPTKPYIARGPGVSPEYLLWTKMHVTGVESV